MYIYWDCCDGFWQVCKYMEISFSEVMLSKFFWNLVFNSAMTGLCCSRIKSPPRVPGAGDPGA